MSKKSSNPITVYTYQEIDNRYKKIIINELIREHDRAQKLVSSLQDLKNQILGVANLKSDAKQGENKDDTITRLTTFLHTIKEKFTNIGESFTTYSKYCDPEVVEENVEEMDYDNIKSELQPTQVKMESIPTEVKAYKLDPNTRSFSGASGEKLSQWLFLIDNAFLAQNIHVDKTYFKNHFFKALKRVA
jgi:hypothetical protein